MHCNHRRASYWLGLLRRLQGKTVLITGGGSGIGRMFTEGYVAGGADVIISSRNSADLKKTCEEMTAMGPGTCRAISVNLATVAGVEALAENLRKELNVTKLHVLVNNSGTTWGGAWRAVAVFARWLPCSDACIWSSQSRWRSFRRRAGIA